MLNRNQRMNIIFDDAKILTARYHNAFCGLNGTVPAKSEAEQQELDRRKALQTYDEVKATGTRTPYKDYLRQF